LVDRFVYAFSAHPPVFVFLHTFLLPLFFFVFTSSFFLLLLSSRFFLLHSLYLLSLTFPLSPPPSILRLLLLLASFLFCLFP
ncbi:hypothetical protein C7A09_28205, partial [Pseudomonas fluorescens]